MIRFLKEVFKPIQEGDDISTHFLMGITFVAVIVAIVTITAIMYAGFSSTTQINQERRTAMAKLYSERGN